MLLFIIKVKKPHKNIPIICELCRSSFGRYHYLYLLCIDLVHVDKNFVDLVCADVVCIDLVRGNLVCVNLDYCGLYEWWGLGWWRSGGRVTKNKESKCPFSTISFDKCF